ncbi:LuxR C-terminal-related transcriptional regulator [Paenibacillus luteus]|uniref:LuxR C-terminal-related transcriptional regulator n=1 Tax=Paenibacillus luteus TaxID=2545753 RepID=UPI0030C80BC6
MEQLADGLHGKLTVITASAGYGKTTIVTEWLAACERPVAWLSMDEGDNDPARFLTYLTAALQTIATSNREGVFALLQSPQLPPVELIITALLNEISAIPDPFILVLDDYHVLDTGPIDHAIAMLIERMPPQLHVIITTRQAPRLPLARLRARNQLAEVRASDLRFTSSEAAEFLTRVMGLSLTVKDITLLESRTEGWIAGLQLAALSVKGHEDPASFIQSFTGSHRFVMDYLVEEVLQQQSLSIQVFLLRTSILERLSGPLCDAVLCSDDKDKRSPSPSGQEQLEFLERANLFIVPLDNERQWYRYHHLFADLLRKRLHQNNSFNAGDGVSQVAQLHTRASKWYEEHGQELDAFHHAGAAGDHRRAARLAEGNGMPLLFRGAVYPVMKWLDSLSNKDRDEMPSLWVMHASAMLMVGQLTGVEQKLQAAEQALRTAEPDDNNRDLLGHISAIRASLAVSKHQADTIITESIRALEYLHPNNLPVRTATNWALGYAYHLQGDRIAARKAYTEALVSSQMIGHAIISIMSTLGLGHIHETENELEEALQSYRQVLTITGDSPIPVACEAHLGLARIFYEWNDLERAKKHGEQSVQLAKQFDSTDRVVAGEVLLAKVKLAEGERNEAAALLAKAELLARQHHFTQQLPTIVDTLVLVRLQQGDMPAADDLAQKHERRLSQARVQLEQRDMAGALALLGQLKEEAEAAEHKNEQLKVMVLLSVVLQASGEKSRASQILAEALRMAEPGGFIRSFVDEGRPMQRLLCEAAATGMMQLYLEQLLTAYTVEGFDSVLEPSQQKYVQPADLLIERLSERELEVLRLIAEGRSNREISERLFLALSTVKGHNRMIFDKLQVTRRTEAVACARKSGLL